MKSKPISRRNFLAKSSAAAPMVLSSAVLGINGKAGANSLLNIGHIGLGAMGLRHLDVLEENPVFICDVDKTRIAEAARKLKKSVKTCTDYREVLNAKKESYVDAVIIATPDHWHGHMTMHALERGKHVYVESPAFSSVGAGKAMNMSSQMHHMAIVVGAQGRCHPASVALHEYIQDRVIGEIQRVECWCTDNPMGGDAVNTGKAPETLNWDLWVGPAKAKEYNPDYCHFNFRWMLDFGGGQLCARGAHVFSVISMCLGLHATGPVKVEADGEEPTTGIWDVPQKLRVEYEFKNPDLTVTWDQRSARPADYDFGAVFIGTKGKTVLKGGADVCIVEQKVLDHFAKKHSQPVPDKVEALKAIQQAWLECVRGNRSWEDIGVRAGHRVSSMCSLGNLSYKLKCPLAWDPKKEEVIGNDKANSLLGGPSDNKYPPVTAPSNKNSGSGGESVPEFVRRMRAEMRY